ncbi:hypothetical protein K7X08_003444 [Anisodus acutangulus]|uniref:Uncharacterized protein n=1 Tax=Anisodus acutangulus TaxID=402998 RepID=A0A9Q1MIJ2_9SOLA|nr:hypothetical protein K7X08_003444 [Anisodus acutangulus]
MIRGSVCIVSKSFGHLDMQINRSVVGLSGLNREKLKYSTSKLLSSIHLIRYKSRALNRSLIDNGGRSSSSNTSFCSSCCKCVCSAILSYIAPFAWARIQVLPGYKQAWTS